MSEKIDWKALKVSAKEEKWWKHAYSAGARYSLYVFVPDCGTAYIKLSRFRLFRQQIIMMVDVTENNLIIPANPDLWATFSKRHILKLISENNDNPAAFLDVLQAQYIDAYPEKTSKKLQEESKDN